jgi:hypothetical protein
MHPLGRYRLADSEILRRGYSDRCYDFLWNPKLVSENGVLKVCVNVMNWMSFSAQKVLVV